MPGLPQNNIPLNRVALQWLKEAKTPAPAHYLHLLTLAAWGLENGAQGDWPEDEQAALQEQVNVLFGWKPKNAMEWLLSNPNGPDKDEQRENLLNLLKTAEDPQGAAAHVLNAIYSRQVSQNTALQPAASELS
jgi:hypothetical protein